MAKPGVRLGAVQIVFAISAFTLVARLVQVQLVDGARYRARAVEQRTSDVELPARRGAILDRGGVTLARTQETYHVEVARNELRDPERDLALIARHLGLRPKTLRDMMDNYIYLRGPFRGAAVQPLRAMRGVHLTRKLERFHPDPGFAQPILGWPARDGRPASGIERVLDHQLSGVSGHAVVLKDGMGRQYESPSRLDAFPVPGHDVYLTLDAGLQEIVEDALRQALEQYEADAGDVVVLNPGTGEVLAVSSQTRRGIRTAGAFTSVFEPGSTAKSFVLAALFEGGHAGLTDSVSTGDGTYEIAGRTIHDDHGGGRMTLADVMRRSSNVGIVKFSERLAPLQQFEMLRRFGLGSPTGVEFPSESSGILRRPEHWSGVTSSSLAIGYEIAVTPLQLAQAYGAIANGGVLMRPTLVLRVTSPTGDVVYRHTPEPVRRVIPAEAADDILTALRGVVSEGGTGETAALTTYALAGKTGTAHKAGPEGYVEGVYTANFVSLFPADNPQQVWVVKLDNPKDAYARLTAAPLTRVMIERVLAAQTGALDWARLSEPLEPNGAPPGTGLARQRTVIDWPPVFDSTTVTERPVPDVVGSSLREAARTLHRRGLRMSVSGWGRVERTQPAAGTLVVPGAVVHVTARVAPIGS